MGPAFEAAGTILHNIRSDRGGLRRSLTDEEKQINGFPNDHELEHFDDLLKNGAPGVIKKYFDRRYLNAVIISPSLRGI